MVIKYVEQCTQTESIEAGYCLKAITDLCSVELGFKDVQIFMLARKHSVLLNLIGLQYCICCLGISVSDLHIACILDAAMHPPLFIYNCRSLKFNNMSIE